MDKEKSNYTNKESEDMSEVEKEAHIEDVEIIDEEDEEVEVIHEGFEDEVDGKEKSGNDSEELANLKEQFVRLQADFQNYKRRVEDEKKQYISLGVEKISSELIIILDNFERALDSLDCKDDSYYTGVEMIQKQLIELLERNNVSEIEAINEKFDPNYHHGVVTEHVDGVEPGIVIEVLQKGYLINNKVLRPAMVKVSE